MKKAFKRILKRIFLLIMIIFAVYLLISNIDLIRDLASDEKIKVLIDSDAAQGVDDIFSILRIMEARDVEVVGLHSAQWRLADLDNDSTVRTNDLLHEFILAAYKKARIPRAEGNALPLQYSFADGEYTDNPASSAIIRAVHELAYQQKLNVLCLGSATNLATAVLQKPEIKERIVCYILGPIYEPGRRTWDKSDPVTRLDLEAMNILLNEENLEVHLLPANTASELVLMKSEIREVFEDPDTIQQRIMRLAESVYPLGDSLPCPSLALVQAYRNPDMATQKQLIAPPENRQRKIYVYTRIDADRMKKDILKSFQGK